MIKYGLEKELFVLNDKKEIVVITPIMDIPYDESGLLAEARGWPSDKIEEACYSMLADEHRIKVKAKVLGFVTCEDPIMIVPRDTKREARRIHTKGLLQFQNIYGFKDNRHKQNEATAAIHISFTENRVHTFDYDNRDRRHTFDYYAPFDYIKYFVALDKAFKQEIKESKRNPGFYEFKPDGRIEYRSLPSNASIDKIIEVINSIK